MKNDYDFKLEEKLPIPSDGFPLRHLHNGYVIELTGFEQGGAPNEVSLPETTHEIVLRPGASNPQIEVEAGVPLRVTLPGPPARRPPPMYVFERRPEDKARPTHVVLTTPPADEKNLYPRELVCIGEIFERNGKTVLRLAVRPVQYDPVANEYVVHPKLRYRVSSEQLSPESVRDRSLFIKKFEHMIVTTEYLAPSFEDLVYWKALRGVRSCIITIEDIVAGRVGNPDLGKGAADQAEILRNFIRWAHQNWGVSYVLLGSDIPSRHGPYTLSGIPMRKIATIGHPRCFRSPEDAKWDGLCEWDKQQPTIAKLLVNDWVGDKVSESSKLVSYDKGTLIPFSSENTASSGAPRWYFISYDEWQNKKTGFTPLKARVDHQLQLKEKGLDWEKPMTCAFVVVEGPENIVNDDFHFITSEMPTDFYYESLENSLLNPIDRPYSQPGKHDFDSNGNGIYAQYTDRVPQGKPHKLIDNVRLAFDVSVGRVPAQNKDEASAFVEKLISYEWLQPPSEGGVVSRIDPSYLRRIVIAARYHWTDWRIEPFKGSGSPEPGFFYYDAQKKCTFIHLRPLPWGTQPVTITGDWDIPPEATNPGDIEPTNLKANEHCRLIAHTRDDTAKKSTTIVIPYGPDSTKEPRWYYARSAGDTTPFPDAVTAYVVVQGTQKDIKFFSWDLKENKDVNTCTAENLRKVMAENFPSLDDVQCLYEEMGDVSGPISPLDQESLRDLVLKGCHFLSLNDHGGPDETCYFDAKFVSTLNGKRRFFIAYSTGCSTARPDWPTHNIGAQLVLTPMGGAVAYIGATRGGWPDTNGATQIELFSRLAALATEGDGIARIGPAASHRRPTGTLQFYPTFFEQILYGDPEMPVWLRVPQNLTVEAPSRVVPGASYTIVVREKLFTKKPIKNASVTLLAGWKGVDGSALYVNAHTDEKGRATVKISPELKVPCGVRLAVWAPGYIPYVDKIQAVTG